MKKLLLIALILFAGNATASSLPDCPSDQSKRYHNCFGAKTSASGQKYVGEFKDDERHGQGTNTWADGDKYVGEFKDGKRHGQGTDTYASGDTYVGEYKDDKPTGQGTYTWANGNTYVGELKDGKRHGQGTNTYANGDIYVGKFKDDERHGQGTFTFSNGVKYAGEWIDGKFADKSKERLAIEMAEKKTNTIYNACLLDKSKEVDMQVSEISKAVYKTCEDIAADPSWYENYKYNK